MLTMFTTPNSYPQRLWQNEVRAAPSSYEDSAPAAPPDSTHAGGLYGHRGRHCAPAGGLTVYRRGWQGAAIFRFHKPTDCVRYPQPFLGGENGHGEMQNYLLTRRQGTIIHALRGVRRPQQMHVPARRIRAGRAKLSREALGEAALECGVPQLPCRASR